MPISRPLIRPPPAASDRPVVRVVQPCGAIGLHRDALERGLARLERAGCCVRWDPSRADSAWRGHMSGPDELRAAELCAALSEPGVEVVWCARGGSGGGRVVETVLAAVRAVVPRILVGFSDATVFLNALAARLGWVTFHGPMVIALGRPDVFPVDVDALVAVLTGDRRQIGFAPGVGEAIEGDLLGGNLSVLASTAGTPAWPHRPGALWLLEDVGEPLYRIDRMAWTLRSAGLFAGAAGVWLGDLDLDGEDRDAAHGALRADLDGLPVHVGAPAGHRGAIDMLPIGARVLLDPAAGWLTAREPWVAPRTAYA